MNIFKKIFGNQSEEENQEDKDNKSPYSPEDNLPVDLLFTTKFKKNGGKFIYCLNIGEVFENFENILEENDWFEKDVLCFENKLFHFLEENKLNYNNPSNPSFLFTTCEGLIADEGSVLFTSNQLKHFKLNELPTDIVVFASASQIYQNKSDGMSKIKIKYNKQLPTNITAINYFEKSKNEDDFLHYGSCHKNVYLLLLEDL